MAPRSSPSLTRCTQGGLAAVLLSIVCVLLANLHRASTEEGSVSVERRRLAAYGAEAREWRALAHRMRADARRTIFFIHVSKSGGTSFCLTGMENECHDAASAEKDMTARDNIHSVGVDNCWSRQLRDGPKWAFNERAQQRQAAGEHFTHQSSSCARRLEWGDAHQVTLMAVENYLPAAAASTSGGMLADTCWRQFVVVMLFRDPIERIYSHFVHIMTMKDSPVNTSDHIRRQPEMASLPEIDALSLTKALRHLADNLYTRMLCGRDAFELPFGQVSVPRLLPMCALTVFLTARSLQLQKSHATAARLALRSFDWVIPLDSPHVEVIVREGLGWTGEWPATLGGSACDS